MRREEYEDIARKLKNSVKNICYTTKITTWIVMVVNLLTIEIIVT